MSLSESASDNQGNGLHLVAFCCANSSPRAAQLSKSPFQVDGLSVRLILLACSSKLEIPHILRALETGADAVALFTCPDKACRFGRGSIRAGKRIERSRRILEQVSLGGRRIFLDALDPADEESLDRALKTAAAGLVELGKSPLKSICKKSEKGEK